MIHTQVVFCSEYTEGMPSGFQGDQRGLPVNFPLKVLKTIQAIGVLLRADGVKRMNYMRLLKLLYIADRRESP